MSSFYQSHKTSQIEWNESKNFHSRVKKSAKMYIFYEPLEIAFSCRSSMISAFAIKCTFSFILLQKLIFFPIGRKEIYKYVNFRKLSSFKCLLGIVCKWWCLMVFVERFKLINKNGENCCKFADKIDEISSAKILEPLKFSPRKFSNVKWAFKSSNKS